MMLVQTYVAPSEVEGVGVFAAKKIEKGDLIWRYDPSFDRLVPATWAPRPYANDAGLSQKICVSGS